MIEALESADLPKPVFLSKPERFKLIMYKERFGKQELAQWNLSERQIKAIAYLKAHGSITNSVYQEITGAAKRTATRELSDMLDKGILMATTTSSRGRGKVYEMKI